MVLSIRSLLPVTLVLFGLLPAAQSVPLSGPLERKRGGSIYTSDLTSDGAFAVFLADRDTPSRLELYSGPPDGSGYSMRLNDPLPTGRFIRQWAIGADNRAVYLVSAGSGAGQLFSVPIDGTAAPLSLSSPNSVLGFFTTKDDVRVLVQMTPGASVHVVPIDGGPAFELPGTAGMVPRGFSPDGTRVLLEQTDLSTTFGSLYSCPADGSAAPVLLARHDQLPPLPDVGLHIEAFTADGLRLLYTVEYRDLWGDPRLFSQWSLFSVPIDGSAPTLELTTAPSEFYVPNVALDAGVPGGRIAFLDGSELVSMLPDGSARTILTPPGLTVEVDGHAELVADGTELFFIGVLANRKRTILRVPLDGSAAPVALFPPQQGGGYGLALAGTDSLLCIAFHGQRSLVRVPRAGGNPQILASEPLEIRRFQTHPDGASALFLAYASGIIQLYRVPLDASSPPLELTSPVYTNELLGRALEFAVTPDQARAVYRIDSGGGLQAELQVAELAQPGVARELSGSDAVGPGIVPTLDSTRVVYRMEAGALRIVPLDGSSAPLTLDASPGTLTPVLTHDGANAIYDADFGLRKVALDGTGVPLVLVVPPAAPRVFVRAIVLDRQNVNAFFLVELRTQFSSVGRNYLYQVPLDGSAPARLLHPEFSSAGGVEDFRISPDGRHVVYRASQIDGSSRELYVVDLDGHIAPRRLNPASHSLGSFGEFALSDDGRLVVLRARQFASGNAGLFSAPIDVKLRSAVAPPSGAGQAFVQLTHLNSKRMVEEDFLLAGDAVVFRADAQVTDRIEVFKNPLDSGRGRTRVSGTMTTGGDASALSVSDGGQWIVYIADQNTNNARELFAVPTAGGTPKSLLILRGFTEIVWSAEESTGLVHLRGDARGDANYELFSVPLDASAPPVLRNSLFLGDVEPDFFPLGDGRLIFRASAASTSGRPELHLAL